MGVPTSLLKGAIFSLTFSLQEESFFVHISCVLCGNVVGDISSPSEAYAAAATAAKSLQSCPTLCNPIDGSPPGSPVPGILQARTLE